MTNERILNILYSAADAEYKKFNAKIVNTGLPMIGVRTPKIKELAKQIAKEPDGFFDSFKLDGYEQILLYALSAAYLKAPIRQKLNLFDKVLPLFDNWAHVDMSVAAFKDLGKNRDLFLSEYAYLAEAPEFMRRVMAVFLMDYCLTGDYLPTVFKLYTQMQCDAYYVNMGIAWGLSVALVKFYEPAVQYLKKGLFNEFIVKKTVQKACESYRVPPERKAELKNTFILK